MVLEPSYGGKRKQRKLLANSILYTEHAEISTAKPAGQIIKFRKVEGYKNNI